MNNVFLDLETLPSQSAAFRAKAREGIKPPGNIKKADSIQAWMDENADTAADEAVAKTSFDPAHGHICTIGFAIEDGPVEAFHISDISYEATIIGDFFAALPKMGLCKFIGHNLAAFDLRFLMCRAIVLGVKLPSVFPRDIKPWSDTVFDTMIAWAGPRGTISQDRLAQALGLEGKGDFDGSMVAAAWAAGEHDKIRDYCRRDIETVRQIYRKFEAAGF